MFTEKDHKQFKKLGITIEEVNSQLKYFKEGFPVIKLHKPATLNYGIKKLSQTEEKHFVHIFNSSVSNKKIIKFIPASGAATRMFKPFFNYLEDPNKYELDNFIKKLNKVAFYDDLKESLYKKSKDIQQLLKSKNYRQIVNEILDETGLNYKNLPKGLIKFHKYTNGSRTAFEEHIIEAKEYCAGMYNETHLRFTISSEHTEEFKRVESQVLPEINKNYRSNFSITYSYQTDDTDTIAVDTNNQPFRLEDGSIHFRPGGHGALLKNLNSIEGDMIYIKNIDNIANEKYLQINAHYKKILGGYLIHLKERNSEYLKLLQKKTINKEKLEEIIKFLEIDCLIHHPDGLNNYSLENLIEYFYSKLNRPVRVCGMVKNEGQPGGGPFWVEHDKKSISLQIVESAQIDNNNKSQIDIFQQSTHFNPVDIVCNIQNNNSKNYNLSEFRDNNTGFIANKSFQGEEIKALELPGLWNGSMSDWITVFIEVPIET
ncbi:DUF4301 family protein, partial [Bacteroidota bacterium]